MNPERSELLQRHKRRTQMNDRKDNTELIEALTSDPDAGRVFKVEGGVVMTNGQVLSTPIAVTRFLPAATGEQLRELAGKLVAKFEAYEESSRRTATAMRKVKTFVPLDVTS
jgi:hypothetical protein